jgi:hypothetical protein
MNNIFVNHYLLICLYVRVSVHGGQRALHVRTQTFVSINVVRVKCIFAMLGRSPLYCDGTKYVTQGINFGSVSTSRGWLFGAVRWSWPLFLAQPRCDPISLPSPAPASRPHSFSDRLSSLFLFLLSPNLVIHCFLFHLQDNHFL